MKLGVLFSGGKDSCYALYKAQETDDVACLISVMSKNKESYMFHTPNISLVEMQSEAIGLPLVFVSTEGRKEEELKDLKRVMADAKKVHKIEGIVTGAIASVYQAKRILKICNELNLRCFNPLWMMDQKRLLKELVEHEFCVIITGIFAYPLDEKWLGRRIDMQIIKDLSVLEKKYQMNPAGEGGEIETTVLDAPFFKKRIEIIDSDIKAEGNCGVFVIKKAKLVSK